MIGKKGNLNVIVGGGFNQLQVKFHFLPDLLKKKVIGYALTSVVWVIYEEDEQLYRVPIAKNIKWWEALLTEPEFSAFNSLKQIYVL